MASCKKYYDQETLYELQNWLEKIYSEEKDCPVLLPDEHNVELLLELKNRNEEAEKNANEVIKAKKHLIQKYNEQSEELKNLLKSQKVSLSEDTMKQIESVAELAILLRLQEPDETSFLLAICNLKNALLKMQEQKLNNCFKLSSLSKKIIKLQEHNEVLKSKLKDLEEIVTIQDSKREKIEFVINTASAKAIEYKNHTQENLEALAGKGFKESLKHRNLVSKAESVKKLEEEVQTLTKMLESYKRLPPNKDLAELEVHEKKTELLKLEKEFASLLEEWENR